MKAPFAALDSTDFRMCLGGEESELGEQQSEEKLERVMFWGTSERSVTPSTEIFLSEDSMNLHDSGFLLWK